MCIVVSLVILICISVVTNHVEYIFMCIFANCLSSLWKLPNILPIFYRVVWVSIVKLQDLVWYYGCNSFIRYFTDIFPTLSSSFLNSKNLNFAKNLFFHYFPYIFHDFGVLSYKFIFFNRYKPYWLSVYSWRNFGCFGIFQGICKFYLLSNVLKLSCL